MQKPPNPRWSIGLAQYHKQQALVQRAQSGEVSLPQVDLNDPNQLARLTPAQLELVSSGIYSTTESAAGAIPPQLPRGWNLADLRKLQSDHPENWQAIVNSIVSMEA